MSRRLVNGLPGSFEGIRASQHDADTSYFRIQYRNADIESLNVTHSHIRRHCRLRFVAARAVSGNAPLSLMHACLSDLTIRLHCQHLFFAAFAVRAASR